MPIYYVDTYEGSDANNGLSWGQAWATCFPLKALYGSQDAVTDLEIRFAKTLPIETDYSPFIQYQMMGRRLSGYRKQIFTSGTEQAGTTWTGVSISPFWFSPSGYLPPGTHKFRLMCPASSSGYAVRWAVAGDFSPFNCFELVAGFYFTDNDSPTPAEAWLELATDSAGANVIWSKKIDAGISQYDARLSLLGNNDLPSNAAYAFIRINNPSTSDIYFECTEISAVVNKTHPNYNGWRLLYLPKDSRSSVLAPHTGHVVVSSDAHMKLIGSEGPQLELMRLAIGSPQQRTWDCYRWEAFPYPPDALLPACRLAGSPSNPIKVYGGYDKTTGLRDGVTVMDSANLRWFEGVSVVSIDVRSVALACRRTGKYNEQGVPGIMERVGQGTGKLLRNCYAEHVYIPQPWLGCINEPITITAEDDSRNALINASADVGTEVVSTAAFRNCVTYGSVPFGGVVEFSAVEDSVWSRDRIRHPLGRDFVVRRCGIIDAKPAVPFLSPVEKDYSVYSSYGAAPTYDDCDIRCTAFPPESPYGSGDDCQEFVASPPGYLENCRLWGAYTGPVSHEYPSRNLQFTPLPQLLGPMCVNGATIDGLTQTQDYDTGRFSGAMFSHPNIMNFRVRLSLKNADIRLAFTCVVDMPANAVANYIFYTHHVYAENVILRHTSIASGAVFKGTRLSTQGLFVDGPFASVQEGIVFESSVQGLEISDPNTKVVQNFRFAAPAAGWGRVCATYRGIVHPSGIAGVLGSSSLGPHEAAAGWFEAQDGEVWASNVMKVALDTVVTHSGATSRRMTPLQPLGAISRGSYLVGVVPVKGGVPVSFKAYMRRSSKHVLGGLFIRSPLTKKDIWRYEITPYPPPTYGYTSPPTATSPLHDVVSYQNHSIAPGIWDVVEVTYTPFRDGFAELHAGLRGVPGHDVWIDSIEVTS